MTRCMPPGRIVRHRGNSPARHRVNSNPPKQPRRVPRWSGEYEPSTEVKSNQPGEFKGSDDKGRSAVTGRWPGHRGGAARAGFSRTEFNRTEFNRNEFNQTEFNRTEFNQTEFNRTGFNQTGPGLAPGETGPLACLPRKEKGVFGHSWDDEDGRGPDVDRW